MEFLAPILQGFLIGAILCFSVGPVIVIILKTSLNQGVQAGIFLILGILLSDIMYILITNSFSFIFEYLLVLKNKIAIVGGLFLCVYGWFAFRSKSIEFVDEGELKTTEKKPSYFKNFSTGFITNTLNPAVFIFWFAWATAIQAEAEHSSNTIIYKIITYLVCLSWNFGVDVLKVFFSNKLKQFIKSGTLVKINKLMGGFLMVFGLFLILKYSFRW